MRHREKGRKPSRLAIRASFSGDKGGRQSKRERDQAEQSLYQEDKSPFAEKKTKKKTEEDITME